MNTESTRSFLRLIHPKLEYQVGLARKVQLIEALKVRAVTPVAATVWGAACGT